MIGAADVRVVVVCEMIAVPEPVKRSVPISALVAGMDSDVGFEVDGATEAVACAGPSGSDNGSAT